MFLLTFRRDFGQLEICSAARDQTTANWMANSEIAAHHSDKCFIYLRSGHPSVSGFVRSPNSILVSHHLVEWNFRRQKMTIKYNSTNLANSPRTTFAKFPCLIADLHKSIFFLRTQPICMCAAAIARRPHWGWTHLPAAGAWKDISMGVSLWPYLFA